MGKNYNVLIILPNKESKEWFLGKNILGVWMWPNWNCYIF